MSSPRTVCRLLNQIVSVQEEITLLRAKEQTLKQRLPTLLSKYLAELTVAGVREEASKLYWADKRLADAVKKAFKQTTGGRLVPVPTTIRAVCPRCKEEKAYTCEHWTEYTQVTYQAPRERQRRPACSDCQKLANEKSEAYWLERGGREEAKRRAVHALKSMPYDEYLQTEHWKQTRSLALRRAHYACQLCASQFKLQVHHKTYERRGEEPPEDLIVLCRACHERHHNILASKNNPHGGDWS